MYFFCYLFRLEHTSGLLLQQLMSIMMGKRYFSTAASRFGEFVSFIWNKQKTTEKVKLKTNFVRTGFVNIYV